MKKKSPEIDRLAGIEYYSTSFDGIGGKIKNNNKDFIVKEILHPNFLKELSDQKNDTHIFPIYEIEKRGMDSNHAVMVLREKLGMNFKIVGIKDAKATTTQYASSNYNKRMLKETKIGEISLKLMGFSGKPIEKSILIGNKFRIQISNPKANSKDNLSVFAPEIGNVGNYYGLQRFGSERLVTHLVGRAILKKKFSEATDILLTHTTRFDSKFSVEIREKLRDIRNNPNLLKIIPKGMDIERKIAYEMTKGKEPISALRSIPINIRRLFVQAFQSFIFNKTLSIAIENDFSITSCEKDDLCFEVIDEIVFGKIRKFENSNSSKYKKIPIIRLPGYAFQPGKNRFDKTVKEILHYENITAKDFFIKEMQELSEAGGFRQAAFIAKEFQYKTSANSTEVEFAVPKGTYATTLLREIIKPEDPIIAGF
ncbi:MAG: tRNA pseudouridine(13) synthase TruD [Candidatus Nitrosocosmicus sp.]